MKFIKSCFQIEQHWVNAIERNEKGKENNNCLQNMEQNIMRKKEPHKYKKLG